MRRPLTIIILAWNQWQLTRRCLESLLATRLDGATVMVVDNGSTDETPRQLAHFPDVQVVRLPANLGFVRGNNAGLAAADPASDIVLVNNDMVFTQEDWLERLRAAGDAPGVGVVGCRLRLGDGRLLHAGTYILPDDLIGQQIGALEQDVGQYGATRTVQGVVFACVLLRRAVIEAVGGLCEAYTSYFEDTDYCLRAARAGFATVVCGDVTLVHDEHGSTRDGSAELDHLLRASRSTFARLWRKELQGRYTRRLLWQSIMNFPTGYAGACRQLLLALDDLGVHSAYRYVYGPGTPYPVPEPDRSFDHRLNLIRARPVSRAQRRVGVVFGQGDVFDRNRGRRTVGFTMLEVDGFPAEWVRQANRMDEVWVPSEFNRRGMIEGGVTRPVHVVPLGIDPDYFAPQIVSHTNPDGDFAFLSSFEWGERKEPWLLLKTFNDEFRATEPVRLVCKIMNSDPAVDLRTEIQRLRLRADGGRIGFLINHELPYYQLGSLYRSSDCFISAGRGEGWDMPLMEAMACGVPTIATDWGAHTEFVREDNCYPLRSRGLVPARAKCPYYAGFSWADPDPEHLRHLLRHVFEHREEAAAKGRVAAREMAERWTWRHAAARIRERLDLVGSA